MRIAFASEHPNQISSFSGTPYYMAKAISADSEYFEYIQCPSFKVKHVQRRGLSEIEHIGQFLSKRLQEIDVDAVICQGSSMIPFLKTDKPIVLWHDSTWFGFMKLDFDEFKAKHPVLYEWDRIALEKCSLIAFAADWVRDQAVAKYRIEPQKVHVLPFGANIESASQQDVANFIADRDPIPCRLTFLGRDWMRKGLPLAYDVVTSLNKKGLRARLSVIGCDVPTIGLKRRFNQYIRNRPLEGLEPFQLRYGHDRAVNKVGRLSKDEPTQYRQFSEILQNTHFLLHPASFECFGIALVEANAFGVPVIATDSYGPKTTIRPEINGYLFQQSEYVVCASNVIMHYMNAYEDYKSLAISSVSEYFDRLNWSTSYNKLKELLSEIKMNKGEEVRST